MIVSDLDGTLLNRYHTLDRRILRAIDLALDNGIIFVVATGRALQGHDIGLNFGNRPIYFISNNGAVIHDTKGNVLYEIGLDPEFVNSVVEHFFHLPIDFISREKTFVNTSRSVYLTGFNNETLVRKLLTKMTFTKTLQSFLKAKTFDQSKESILKLDTLKLNTRIVDDMDRIAFDKHLLKFPNVVNLPFSDSIFEITDASVNKAEAVKFLAQRLNIDHDDIYVFGDGGNDVPMLKAFKNSYAPRSGNPEAKAVASEIIGHYWFYAVSRKIEQLIKEKRP